MNKKGSLVVAGVLALTLVSGFFVESIMAANTPGTSSDPLVTKSYVDEKISQILTQIGTGTVTANNPVASASTEEIVSDVVARMEFLYGDKLKATTAPAAPVATTSPTDAGIAGAKYVPVNLLLGQGITGHEGTEIILRSGKAKGKATGENGLVDATDGSEIRNGNEVKMNHIIIVPRADGRGVTATTDAWFLVKGGYDIAG